MSDTLESLETRALHPSYRLHGTLAQEWSLFALLSPVGLASISYVFFIACTVVPPGLYEDIMHEPDEMFLNPVAYVFVTSCVICFCMGAYWAGKVRFRRGTNVAPRLLGRVAVLLPVVVAVGLNLMSVLLISKNTPNLLWGWFVDAAQMKRELDLQGTFSQALPLLYGVCWWALWRLLEKQVATSRKDLLQRFVLGCAFIFALATCVVKVARSDLMPALFGFILVYLVFEQKYRRLNVRSLLIYLAFGLIVMLGLFILFAYLRGNGGGTAVINSVAGYTIASYNRLAGILNGGIRFPYGGTGTYAFSFIGSFPLLHRWFDFGMPTWQTVWSSEFPAVASAGLDGRYIWSSSFGYVYSDIGLLAPAYFLLVGALSGWAWKRLKVGRAAGVVMYPWFAFSIMFWFGANMVAGSQLVTLAVAAFLLSVYDRFAYRRRVCRVTS